MMMSHSELVSLATGVGLVSSRVLLDPGLEAFSVTVAVVVNGAGFLSTGVELESGVSTDVNSFNFVGSGVHLGNNEAGDVLEVSSELFPLGDKLLAVTAPGSVELNENIVVVVNNKGLEVFADSGLNCLVFVSGDILTLEEGGEGPRLEVTDELGEGLSGEGLKAATEGVLLHVVGGVEDAEGGEVRLFNSDKFSKSLLDAVSDTRLNEKDFTLVSLGSLGKYSLEALVGISVRSEEENGSLALAEDRLNVVLREVNQSGD